MFLQVKELPDKGGGGGGRGEGKVGGVRRL